MDNFGNKNILLGPSSFAALDNSPLELLKNNGCRIFDNPFKRKLTKPELLELLLKHEITAILAGLETLDREIFVNSKLRVVSRCGSGMSNVDLEAARELNIQVYSTPLGPTNSVAELTIGCIISLIRHLPTMDLSLHAKKWDKRIGIELCSKNVAVIGFGNIGQAVAKLLTAFGAKVYAVDPYVSSHENIPVVPLNDALAIADIITIHASGESTIISASEFNLMKRGAYLLNAARGGLIDEESLTKALDNGVVAGAWLDSFVDEPYSGPLTEYKQVILTPHIGSYTIECRKKMETEAAKNLLKGLASVG